MYYVDWTEGYDPVTCLTEIQIKPNLNPKPNHTAWALTQSTNLT